MADLNKFIITNWCGVPHKFIRHADGTLAVDRFEEVLASGINTVPFYDYGYKTNCAKEEHKHTACDLSCDKEAHAHCYTFTCEKAEHKHNEECADEEVVYVAQIGTTQYETIKDDLTLVNKAIAIEINSEYK